MKRSLRYGWGVTSSWLLFTVLNVANLYRRTSCDDCFLPYGFAFTFVHHGGFVGVTRYDWPGLFGDLIVIVLTGLSMGAVWNLIATRILKPKA